MNDLMSIFTPVSTTRRFDEIRISIASPERIRSAILARSNSCGPTNVTRRSSSYGIAASSMITNWSSARTGRMSVAGATRWATR